MSRFSMKPPSDCSPAEGDGPDDDDDDDGGLLRNSVGRAQDGPIRPVLVHGLGQND